MIMNFHNLKGFIVSLINYNYIYNEFVFTIRVIRDFWVLEVISKIINQKTLIVKHKCNNFYLSFFLFFFL